MKDYNRIEAKNDALEEELSKQRGHNAHKVCNKMEFYVLSIKNKCLFLQNSIRKCYNKLLVIVKTISLGIWILNS